MNQPGPAAHSLFVIHSAVLLFGLSGLFAKFIDASPLYIVLGTDPVCGPGFGHIRPAGFRYKTVGCLPGRAAGLFILQGALLAVHWYFFFLSIQISSVAVGLVTFSTFPLFVTFMEPLVFKEPLDRRDIATAIVVFAGICLVIPEPDLSNQTTLGGFFRYSVRPDLRHPGPGEPEKRKTFRPGGRGVLSKSVRGPVPGDSGHPDPATGRVDTV